MMRKEKNTNSKGKQITLHFYKRFDSDLIALQVQTGKLNRMIKDALYHFAREAPFTILVPDLKIVDLSEYLSFRMQVYITDPESIEMLKCIRPYARTAFIKTLLRQALKYQMLGAFMTDPRYLFKASSDLYKDLAIPPPGAKIYKFRKRGARKAAGGDFYSRSADELDAVRVDRSFRKAIRTHDGEKKAKALAEEMERDKAGPPPDDNIVPAPETEKEKSVNAEAEDNDKSLFDDTEHFGSGFAQF